MKTYCIKNDCAFLECKKHCCNSLKARELTKDYYKNKDFKCKLRLLESEADDDMR